MHETPFAGNAPHDNVIDKVAHSADRAVDATKNAATAALDSVSNKVESVRSTLSPALEDALAPLESVMQFTRERPVAALAVAVAAGALLSVLFVPSLRSRNH